MSSEVHNEVINQSSFTRQGGLVQQESGGAKYRRAKWSPEILIYTRV